MNPTSRHARGAGQPKAGKPTRPVEQPVEEVTLLQDGPPGTCKCAGAAFLKRPWGVPRVRPTLSQGFTVITITVPVKFQFTCQKAARNRKCAAFVTPLIVKKDFGPKPVLDVRPRDAPAHVAACTGKPTVTSTSVRFVAVLIGEHQAFDGTLQLRFDVRACPGVAVWDMTLVFEDGKLDEKASDYDGDGTPNGEEEPGREWDPDR